jgi:hypothetical protein
MITMLSWMIAATGYRPRGFLSPIDSLTLREAAFVTPPAVVTRESG